MIGIHQSHLGIDLLNQMGIQDLRAATLLLADAAFDDKKTYSNSRSLGLIPLINYDPRRSQIRDFDALPEEDLSSNQQDLSWKN